jgi:uncharacterized protein (DUF58 family)
VNRIAAFLNRKKSTHQAGLHAPLLTAGELTELALQASHLADSAFRREVHDHHAGDWPSAWMGHGLDYEESRPYFSGDDLRDMDWRTTARLTHPFIKIYREEHQPQLHLVVNRCSTMRFGTRKRLKAAQAARIAALSAFAAAASNTAVSATLWDVHDMELPPRHDRSGVLDLVQSLAASCPPLSPGNAKGVLIEADRLARLTTGLVRGTRLMLISDFSWLADEHRVWLTRMSERFSVLAINITDPAERILPNMGLASFVDLTDGQVRKLNTGHAAERESFAQAALQRRERTRQILRQSHIEVLDVGSEEDDLLSVLMQHA